MFGIALFPIILSFGSTACLKSNSSAQIRINAMIIQVLMCRLTWQAALTDPVMGSYATLLHYMSKQLYDSTGTLA